LVIVDDDDSRSAARGFASAEEFLKSGKQHETACLITDIRVLGMSGLELQAHLNAERCRVPMIFITARGDDKMRLQARREGAVDCHLFNREEKGIMAKILFE